jgi:hypothetical protein
MENTTMDFAQALIEDLQDENLFDFEELALSTDKVSTASFGVKNVAPNAKQEINVAQAVQVTQPNDLVETQSTFNPPMPASIAVTEAIPNPTMLQMNSEVLDQPLIQYEDAIDVEEGVQVNEPELLAQESSHHNPIDLEPNFNDEQPQKSNASDDYKKAITEISSLKTIEQIIYGVEQEQLSVNTIPYDTVALNMALLGFQKGSELDEDQVYTEIEKWQSYLLDRDEQISLKDLRYYCETTQPKLSPRAIITLAEFYQNVSKQKFELMLTRAFYEDDEHSEKKHLLCDNTEIARHISKICDEVDDPNVLQKLIHLTTFAEDLKEYKTTDGMIATDVFGSYKAFKNDLGDLFFDVRITAAIIQNNILIGNHFISLVERERALGSKSNIFNNSAFGASFEETISQTVCRTIEIAKIKAPKVEAAPQKSAKQLQIEKQRSELRAKNQPAPTKSKYQQEEAAGGGRVFKLVMLCVILTAVIVGIGYYAMGEGLFNGDTLSDSDIRQNESNRNDK